MENHYDPNQPRVPAGHHGGGRWTSGGGSEALTSPTEKEVSGRDSEKSDSASHSEELISKPAFLDRRPPTKPRQFAVESVLALFGWLLDRNSADRQAVLDFQARQYLRDGPKSLSFKDVRVIDRDEAGETCKRLVDVQQYTDEAFHHMQLFYFRLWEPRQFGTAVHVEVAARVRAEKNPDFLAEQSMKKINQEFTDDDKTLSQEERNKRDLEKKLMVRVDVLENIPNKRTVCVYDIKTGTRGLDEPRMDEIVRFVFRNFKDTVRIIIVQVRPGQGQGAAR